jgi:hypothetical protein
MAIFLNLIIWPSHLATGLPDVYLSLPRQASNFV